MAEPRPAARCRERPPPAKPYSWPGTQAPHATPAGCASVLPCPRRGHGGDTATCHWHPLLLRAQGRGHPRKGLHPLAQDGDRDGDTARGVAGCRSQPRQGQGQRRPLSAPAGGGTLGFCRGSTGKDWDRMPHAWFSPWYPARGARWLECGASVFAWCSAPRVWFPVPNTC